MPSDARLRMPVCPGLGHGARAVVRLIDLDRSRARRFTSEDQKIDYPDDKGLEMVASLQDTVIIWG